MTLLRDRAMMAEAASERMKIIVIYYDDKWLPACKGSCGGPFTIGVDSRHAASSQKFQLEEERLVPQKLGSTCKSL